MQFGRNMEWQYTFHVKVEQHTRRLNLQRDIVERLPYENEDHPVQHSPQAVRLHHLVPFVMHVGVPSAGSGPHSSPPLRHSTLRLQQRPQFFVACESAVSSCASRATLMPAWCGNKSQRMRRGDPTIVPACRCRTLDKQKHFHRSEATFTTRSIHIPQCALSASDEARARSHLYARCRHLYSVRTLI